MPSIVASPCRSSRLQKISKQCAAARAKVVAAKRTPLAPKHNGIACTTATMTFPRKLARPAIDEVDVNALANVYPDLAGVPVQYVRDNLCRSSMRAATQAVNISLPNDSLPKELQVLLNDVIAADCPTHIFAVHSASTVAQKRRVALFPAHDLLFRLHCTRLPELPASRPSKSGEKAKTIPVVPLCLPSLETFPLLHAYLYTQNTPALLASLAPPCEADLLRLTQHARKVYGLWSNACALGVVDGLLYDAIEASWEATMRGMQACQT
ncbi:hypothetical protein FB45DRAFT_918767 [Roridomyces roridus]|uniref:Uncharacterized protein n=1 Tax=Roridomyces roridus TaxID=1738132 RepID=A0AAD7BRD6_9AGAR|nr:hypothetical protein FB45DRAFT_918767 [Roridomyces roridus]